MGDRRHAAGTTRRKQAAFSTIGPHHKGRMDRGQLRHLSMLIGRDDQVFIGK
jgi:hypothetical protein